MREGIATPSARNDTLQRNPKLKALNPKQIPVSKLKVQNCFGHLDFGHSILFRISDLGLGICMLLSLRGTACRSNPKEKQEKLILALSCQGRGISAEIAAPSARNDVKIFL